MTANAVLCLSDATANCADVNAWQTNIQCRIQGSAGSNPNDGFLTLVQVNAGVDDPKTAARKTKAAQQFNDVLAGLTGIYQRLTSKEMIIN